MAYLPNATNGPNGGKINIGGIVGNIRGTSSAISTGTAYIAGGNNVTLSQNGNSINVSAQLLGGTKTLSRWEAPEEVFTAIGPPGNGSLSIQHLYIPYNVSASAAKVAGSISVNTQLVGGNNISASLSLWMGMYKLSGSTLTSIGSGSAAINFTGSIGNTTQQTAVSGMRQFTVPMNLNITPGEYWMAAVISSTGNPAGSIAISMYGNNLVTAGSGIGNLIFAPVGSNSTAASAAKDVVLFQGIHTSIGYTMPATIVGSQINNSAVSAVQRADFYNQIYNFEK